MNEKNLKNKEALRNYVGSLLGALMSFSSLPGFIQRQLLSSFALISSKEYK